MELNEITNDLRLITSDEFRNLHNKLLHKYGITFINDCDCIPHVTGNIYHKEDLYICHIRGIYYNEEHDWCGALESYLILLKNILIDYFGDEVTKAEILNVQPGDEVLCGVGEKNRN